jgi:hypothetical protein
MILTTLLESDIASSCKYARNPSDSWLNICQLHDCVVNDCIVCNMMVLLRCCCSIDCTLSTVSLRCSLHMKNNNQVKIIDINHFIYVTEDGVKLSITCLVMVHFQAFLSKQQQKILCMHPKSGVRGHVDPTLSESGGPNPGTPRDHRPCQVLELLGVLGGIALLDGLLAEKIMAMVQIFDGLAVP